MDRIEDLTTFEILEDLAYWTRSAQYKSPPITDKDFSFIWDDIEELQKRYKKNGK